MKRVQVPKELNHSFFFEQNKEIDIKSEIEEMNFIYEIYFYNGIPAPKPWIHPNEALPKLLEKWTSKKEELTLLHQKMDQKTIEEDMKKGIGLFIQFLFWSNDCPVRLDQSIHLEQLPYHPVNIRERLEFIILKPKLYHSFVQLSELIEEQRKHYVKKSIIKKSSQSKN
ncbi:MAG: hypothetical protein Q8934_04435 [Bacillota bacterium]|nr:hypothetical protein [Bacillota bacterium]